MIRLTRLNNQRLAINSDLIKWVESAPDSVITLISGEKVIVKESVEQIIAEIVAFRRALLSGYSLQADGGTAAVAPSSCGVGAEDPSQGGRRG